MGSHDTETLILPVLPPDILFSHLLPRLPGKSVHRFLCVCKQWQSFLTTPIFAKMHLQHRHPLIIALSTTTPCKFSTIDMEASQKVSALRPLPFEASHENVSIVGIVRGLVCLSISKKRNEMDIILWNPLTGEYKTVYRPTNQRFYQTTTTLFGLYYRCNDYKILLVTKDYNAYLYSLKSDLWRKVETRTTQKEFSCLFRPDDDWMQQYVVLDEKMYFITRKVNHFWMGGCSIIRFDLKTKKLREIDGPDSSNVYVRLELSLWVVRGCLYLSVKYFPLNFETGGHVSEMWRMDGDEDWTKVSHKEERSLDMCFMHPLDMMNNGERMLLHDMRRYKIYELYMEKEEDDTRAFSYNPKETIVFNAGGRYIETLGINIFNN